MRLVFILLSIFYTMKAGAFTYQIKDESLVNPSIFQRHQLSKYFSKAGFSPLTEQGLTKVGLPFDGVYVSDKWEKSILLKAGLEAPIAVKGHIIEEKSLGLLAFHFEFEGVPYLLLAINLSTDEFRNIIMPFNKKKYSQIWSYLLPSAHADYSCQKSNRQVTDIQRTTDYIQNNIVLRSIGRCGLDALQGLQESTKDTLDFFKSLSGDSSGLWNSMKESYNDLKNFALNMNFEFQQMFEVLGKLTPEQKAQIACNMTGKIIMKTAQGLLLAGSLVKLLPSLILSLKKVSEVLKQISHLEGKGFKMPDKSFLAERALSCVK